MAENAEENKKFAAADMKGLASRVWVSICAPSATTLGD